MSTHCRSSTFVRFDISVLLSVHQSVRGNTNSATGGSYVEALFGDETSYVEWNVNVPSSGKYLISLRYANDNSPRPLSVSDRGLE